MRRRLVALCVAVLALGALALMRGGGGGPPLYDGICLAPHYKLLGSSPPPPSVSTVFTAGMLAGTQEAADDTAAPQAQIIIGAGTFAPAPGAASATLTITAVQPPAVRPNGTIDGNVYDFEMTSGGRPVAPAPSHPVTISLGATTSGSSTLTIEHFSGTGWNALRTLQSGCGTTFVAASPTLGRFALVAPGTSSPGNPGGSSGPSPLLFVLGALVVLGLVIAAVRAGRRRR